MSDDDENVESSNAGGISVNSRQLFTLPQPPPNQGPPSISLAYLIDFAVQRTFQDLTVLAELLPKKSDMERQLFIRLLAAVKWAKSAGKIDLCNGISYFLDQQMSMFVDTADRLFQLAREFLPHARLPAFQIPAAVDVLVLGSYPRLPACIKTRFIPDESINFKEQACVLRRLNQIIQHRLIFANVPLHARMQNFTIRNGTVTFTVAGEFEATLTLLGEESNTPWSLLNVKILVRDYEIGEGQELVHPFQVHYLHELAEARMQSCENPIVELYDVLHAFCMYLHLDILYCQASKFIHDRMIEHVAVDEYVHGQRLTISYWRSTTKRQWAIGIGRNSTMDESYYKFNYKLSIHVDTEKKRALRVVHTPCSDVRLPTLDDYDGNLNTENLLCDTILVRIRYRLLQLKQRMNGTIVKRASIRGKVPALEIVLLEPTIEMETLKIGIDLFTGHFVCWLDSLGKLRVVDETERLLNSASWHKIKEKLWDLKCALVIERCRKSVVGLPVTIVETVPLLPCSTILRTLSSNRLLLRFHRHETFYLVVELISDDKYDCELRYFLLSTCSANALTSVLPVEKRRENSGICEFVKPLSLLLLEPNTIRDVPGKVAKKESYFISELMAVVKNCDQRIPFASLYEEFDRRGIKYQSIDEEMELGCLICNILGFTKVPPNVDKRLLDTFWSESVVSLSGRLMHDRNRLHWTFELVTRNLPLIGIHRRNIVSDDYGRVNVTNTPVVSDGAAKCADELITVMASYCQFYDLITRFAPAYIHYLNELCRVINLSATRLVLSYGPGEKPFFVMLQWKHQESQFHVSFATNVSDEHADMKLAKENPHTIMASFVQAFFNRKRDLAYLMRYLNDTLDPLSALQRLPQFPVVGATENQTQPVGYAHVFAVLPIDETRVRLFFKWYACIELYLIGNGEIILRDCGAQNGAKNITRFTPIIGLEAFFAIHEQLASASTGWLNDENRGSSEDTKSPFKMKPDSVNTVSPAHSYPTPSPASNMVAPSPAPASTPNTQQQGIPSQGPMTPSPAPATSFAGLLTPSPAAPLSNAGMLMTPSPAPFGSLQSPAQATTQCASTTNNAPQLSPTGPEPSPLSFMKSFASEASAASGGETKGNGNEFSNWSEFGAPAMTPITTSALAPLAVQNVPISSAPMNLLPMTSAASSVSKPTDSTLPIVNTEDWIPSSDPILISHAALRSACTADSDGRCPLMQFLGSISALEKFLKLNSVPFSVGKKGSNMASILRTTNESTVKASVQTNGDMPGQFSMKIGTLEIKIYLDDKTMSKLILKVLNTVDGGDLWTDDDLRVLERYFVEFVSPIHHQHAIAAFLRLLKFSRQVHAGALKSLVALMRHQLKRDTIKPWSPSICLTLPPPHLVTPYLTNIGTSSVVAGMMAIMVNRDQRKMLLWVKLVSNMDNKQQWIFPLLYDGVTNGLTVFTGAQSTAQQHSAIQSQFPIIHEVNSILQRYATPGDAYQNYIGECSIWTSINGLAELLSHQNQQQGVQETMKT